MRWSGIFAVSYGHYIHDVYSSFLAPLLPFLIDKLAIGYGMAAMLAFAQRIPSLTNPVMGLIADRISMRYVMVAAPALTGVSMSLLGLAPNYGMLLLLLLVMGVGSSAFHVPAPIFIKKDSGKRISLGMSWFMIGGELSRMSGPLIIISAISFWTLEGTWRLVFFGLTASLVLLVFTHDNPKKAPKRTGNHLYHDVAGFFMQYNRLFIGLGGFVFFRSLLKSAMTAFLPVYLLQKGETIWVGGMALSLLQLSGTLGVALAGNWADRLGKRNVLGWSVVLSIIFMLFFLITSGPAQYISLFFLGIVMFAPEPALLAIVNETRTDQPGLMNGIYMSMRLFGAGLAVLIVGFFSDWFSLRQVYQWTPFLSLLALPFIIYLREKKSEKHSGDWQEGSDL